MKIELYLEKINQEMIQVGPGSRADCTTYVSWTKSCCILDFKLATQKSGFTDPGYLMRKEEFGGLLWSPRTGAVYQLDEEAYHTLLELEHGLNEELVARRMRVPTGQVHTFVGELTQLGLL